MRRVTTLVLAVALLVPAAAGASSDELIADCTKDSKLDKEYSQKEYKAALNDLGADADEYTNCRDIIGRAQQKAAREKQGSSKQGGGDAGGTRDGGAGGGATNGGSGGGGGAGPDAAQPGPAAEPPPTPAETQALEQIKADRSRATFDAARVASAPGISSDTDLPTSVVVLLSALALGAVALCAQRVTSRVRSRRSA